MLFRMHPSETPLTRMRRSHEAVVLGLLRRGGPLSRAELGARSGLSRSTLYEIVGGLLSSGVVVAAGPQGPRRRGRPVELISLNPGTGYALGIDFARRAVHVALVNAAHEVIGRASEPHSAELSPAAQVSLARRLAARLGALPRQASGPDAGGGSSEGKGRDEGPGAERAALSAVGVGVVGPAPDDRPERHERLADALREAFGVPVVLDNNTRLAALAEATWGAAAGEADAVYLRLSHGVGGGLVVGGALHRGARGLSGEIGHTVVDPDGVSCGCGSHGCLETRASIPAVLAAVRERGAGVGSAAELVAAAASGQPAVTAALAEVGRLVGRVLAGLCNAVGPGVLVLGGELADTGPALLAPLEEELRAHVVPFARDAIDLRRAALGDYGGALGGIALALHESPLLSHYPVGEPDADRIARAEGSEAAPAAPARRLPSVAVADPRHGRAS